ncbi:MAG: hypothetical protein MUF87_02405 [Anaerolineae bacterium]|nr:hypothetical protein [Anaerolineae bacterium]
MFTPSDDFQFTWLPASHATAYTLILTRDGIPFAQSSFFAEHRCSPVYCELYPPLSDLPLIEAGYTYAWSVKAQTTNGVIMSLPSDFTVSHPLADFTTAPEEFSEPQSTTPAWIVYADSWGLNVLDPNVPNTDPRFDQRILTINAGGADQFYTMLSPVWKPNTTTLAFVSGKTYQQGTGLGYHPRDIWTMNVNGNSLTQLTYTPETEQQLAWSCHLSLASQSD